MSFLDEILASKGLAEAEELNDKIQEITKSTASLKEEVTVIMEDTYINFSCALDDTTNLMNKLKKLSVQVNDVSERLDVQIKNDLITSKAQLDSLTEAMQEVALSHDIITRLLKIHQAIDVAQNVGNESKFLVTAQHLKRAGEDLQDKSSGLECLQIFEALKSELIFQQSKHSYNTVEMWSQSVLWSETIIDGSYKTVSLSVATNVDKEELFKALYYYGLLTTEMREFSEKLLKDVLYTIISKPTLVNCENSSTLTVKVDLKSKKQPQCVKVINDLTIVFNFLSLQIDLKATDDICFISECKKQISHDFCRYFTKNCLSVTVPKKRDQLEQYKELMEDIIAFEQLLKHIGIT